MNNVQETLNLRRQRVAKTFKREIPDKVPIFFAAETYAPYYAGVKLKDITTYDQALEVEKKVTAELQYDCTYFPYLPNNLLEKRVSEILGGGMFAVSDDGIKQVNPKLLTIMEEGDYPGLIKDPFNYLLETIFPRRFKTLTGDNQEEKYEKIVLMFQELQKVGEYCKRFENELGVALLQDNQLFFNPVDYLFDYVRSFGIIRDVKVRPEEVRDAGLAMVDGILKYTALKTPVEYRTYFCPMHIPTYLSPKDFEKTYWPSFKALTEGIVSQGHNIMFEFEVDYSHLFDFLQDLPKTHVAGIFEMKDMKLVKEKLGKTMAIAGGLDTNVLYHGTKQDCIDMVKRLIDDLAYDGGYFLTPGTPLCGPIDAKPENLKAAFDFANEYGVYK